MYEVGSRAAVQLRRLVIDLEEPCPPPQPDPLDLEKQPYLRHLNPEQLLAVQRYICFLPPSPAHYVTPALGACARLQPLKPPLPNSLAPERGSGSR